MAEKKKRKWVQYVIIFVVVIVLALILFSGGGESKEKDSTLVVKTYYSKATNSLADEDYVDAYEYLMKIDEEQTNFTDIDQLIKKTKKGIVNNASWISWENLLRKEDDYKGKLIGIKGEVFDTGSSYVLMFTEYDDWWGYTDNIAYVKYDTDMGDKLLDGDIVIVYGIYKGEKNYENVMGGDTQSVYIEALYWYVTK